ncbi:Lipolytic protein G-D-S-L family [Hyella patelloides LEGE 07179]|uniref:Lipolytic protein G-D-S-L family n=1 Tax=Hyella patelloides LEGE 07179 TaxID=945734 RepID=A0A563VQG5_9CYAN|nr:GDSL-type esterase/lipase family protein [Hyella patelloides]VEP13507.1 Lipolytic protein G-D-S-L family [Hyella patelloides LEGE 07179]
MPKLICLGDSITAKEKDSSGTIKLTLRLKQVFSGWTIINAGVGGDNSRGALNRLQNDVLNCCPDLVTVLLGTADASENKGVDIKEYEQNLISIVEQITPQKTLLISSPPIDEKLLSARKKAFPESNFVTMETLEQYIKIVTKVAYSTNSHFLDLWSLMRSQSNYSRFLQAKDGVHFNQQGYEFLTQVLSEKIQSIAY